MTVQELITSSLRAIGVLAAGQVLSAEDGSDALDVVNRLIDSYSLERLQIFKTTRTTFTIVSGTQDYQVGSGAEVNIARPAYIDYVHFQRTDTSPVQEFPMVPFTEDAWAAISQKTVTNAIPSHWYYNPKYPLGELTLWPNPTGASLQGVIGVPTAVSEFALVTETISLPPGYRRMLETNLAIELAPRYGAQVHPMLMKAATESKINVKRLNVRMSDLSFDSGALGQSYGSGWNIRTDS